MPDTHAQSGGAHPLTALALLPAAEALTARRRWQRPDGVERRVTSTLIGLR